MSNYRIGFITIASLLLYSLVAVRQEAFAAFPLTTTPQSPSTQSATNGNTDAELALESLAKDLKFIREVGYPILRNSLDACQGNTALSLGVFFTNVHDFKPKYREFARRKFNLGDRLKVVHTLPGYPGQRQGLLEGDELISIDDQPIPFGEHSLPALFSLLQSSLAKLIPSKLVVNRSGRTVALSVTPMEVCNYPIIVTDSSEPYAFANGKEITLSRGVLRVVESQSQLAAIIAHELAHNILNHAITPNVKATAKQEFSRLSAIYGLSTQYHLDNKSDLIYSDAYEMEADYISLIMLAVSNYPIGKVPDYVRQLSARTKDNPWGDRPSKHPASAARYAALEQSIQDIELSRLSGPLRFPSMRQIEALRRNRVQMQVTNNSQKLLNSSEQARVWADASFTALQAENWDKAIRAASAAIDLDPNFDTPYINRAWAYIEKNQLDKSIQDSNKAIQINPANGKAFNNRGYAYQQLRNSVQAQENYRRACELREEAGCLNYEKLTGHRPDEVKDLIRQLRNGTYAQNYQSRQEKQQRENVKIRVRELLDASYEQFSRNQWREVVRLSNEILEYEPENTTALVNRAGAFAELEQLDQALDDCNRALQINPNYGLAYHNRGYIYEKQGDTLQALREYQQSCQLNVSASCTDVHRLSQ